MSANQLKSVHPFPARMAPEIALHKLRKVTVGKKVLDPMMGSGTVLRQAAIRGLKAYGCDLDPLAVMISRTGVATVQSSVVIAAGKRVVAEVHELLKKKVVLPWIDRDIETERFIKFWFGRRQIRPLRCLAYSMRYGAGSKCSLEVRDALHVAFSRIIVTKKSGASLAWDVSHSRPHKVLKKSDFDVIKGFTRSCNFVANRIFAKDSIKYQPQVKRCDARNLSGISDSFIDVIITSPPYLNAIDYLRGHRLALVWLGYRLSDLRKIRGESVGAERNELSDEVATYAVLDSFGRIDKMPQRLRGSLVRYAGDLMACVLEYARVLKAGGRAHFVVGDSKIKGFSVKNSAALTTAAEIAGFRLTSRKVRKLPPRLRYLPTVNSREHSLGKRMTSELILTYSLASK